jgi:hypothetical protein
MSRGGSRLHQILRDRDGRTAETGRLVARAVEQMAVYFPVIEEELRIRPSHGVIVCGDGTRHRVENTEELRAWVLDLARQIRAGRQAVTVPIPVNPTSVQCRPCGMRGSAGRLACETSEYFISHNAIYGIRSRRRQQRRFCCRCSPAVLRSGMDECEGL